MSEIVKVQLPLATNSDIPLALIYNEDRSIKTFLPISDEIEKAMNGRYKAYFKSKLDGTHLLLEEEVEEQEW